MIFRQKKNQHVISWECYSCFGIWLSHINEIFFLIQWYFNICHYCAFESIILHRLSFIASYFLFFYIASKNIYLKKVRKETTFIVFGQKGSSTIFGLLSFKFFNYIKKIWSVVICFIKRNLNVYIQIKK